MMAVMVELVPFLLLFISAGTLVLLPRIIRKYVCRAKARRMTTTHGVSRESEPQRPVIDGDEEETLKAMIERLGDAEERSGPEFKFSFRFPDDILRRAEAAEGRRHDSTEHESVDAEEEEEALHVTTTTSPTISSYRLAAKRNVSGFMVHPEGLNCRVEESFVSHSGFSSLPGSRSSRNIEARETRKPSGMKDEERVVVTDEPEEEDQEDEGNEKASNPDEEFFFSSDEPVDEEQSNCWNSFEDDKTIANEPEDKEETAISVGGDAVNDEASNPDGGLFFHADVEEGKTLADEPEDAAISIGGDAANEEASNPDGGFFFHADEPVDREQSNCPKSEEGGKTLADEPEVGDAGNEDHINCRKSDEEGKTPVNGVENDGSGLMPFDSFDKGDDGSTEEESEPKALQSKPDAVSERGRETPTSDHFLAEEDFDGVGLDSSCTSSFTDDGYSVRSVAVDAGSDDGFLSEFDICGLAGNEDEEDGGLSSMNGSVVVEEEEEEEEEEEVRRLVEEERHIDRVLQEANLVITRLSSSVGRPEEEAYAEECDDELEKELRNLEAEQGQAEMEEEEEEVALPHLSSSDEEEFRGSDGLSRPIAAAYNIQTHSDQSDEEDEELSSPIPESASGDGSPEDSDEMDWDDTDWDDMEKHGKAGAGKKGESDELEALWEHQDLIEQLSEELMFVRSAGLETIHEEPRSPNLSLKLGDWKFDAAFLHDKPNDELQTFFKIYRERMRKLDILNYQKMYAIDFLQPKGLPQSLGRRKPKVSSLLAENFLSRRRRKPEDRSQKFTKELHGGLENVYVGQICLSWEFLSWQYEKAQDLTKPDPHGCRRYNRAAGEFRHFQVLIRRFLENESFEDGRVPFYVKSRRDLTDLLQVPAIKVDERTKGKGKGGKESEIINLEELDYIMVNSIRLFWQFVKADKDETPMLVKGLMGSQVELQDPTDGELMELVQEQLHKKQKKLRDVVRAGNCLVKKLKRTEQDVSSHDQDQFFSQVDMKLVSRVLQMPKLTTEQLVWCHNKLRNITILGRDVRRETAFLPFPCST